MDRFVEFGFDVAAGIVAFVVIKVAWKLWCDRKKLLAFARDFIEERIRIVVRIVRTSINKLEDLFQEGSRFAGTLRPHIPEYSRRIVSSLITIATWTIFFALLSSITGLPWMILGLPTGLWLGVIVAFFMRNHNPPIQSTE